MVTNIMTIAILYRAWTLRTWVCCCHHWEQCWWERSENSIYNANPVQCLAWTKTELNFTYKASDQLVQGHGHLYQGMGTKYTSSLICDLRKPYCFLCSSKNQSNLEDIMTSNFAFKNLFQPLSRKWRQLPEFCRQLFWKLLLAAQSVSWQFEHYFFSPSIKRGLKSSIKWRT